MYDCLYVCEYVANIKPNGSVVFDNSLYSFLFCLIHFLVYSICHAAIFVFPLHYELSYYDAEFSMEKQKTTMNGFNDVSD